MAISLPTSPLHQTNGPLSSNYPTLHRQQRCSGFVGGGQENSEFERMLREKEIKLTDIRLEALATAHQLGKQQFSHSTKINKINLSFSIRIDQSKEENIKMRIELEQLRCENVRMQQMLLSNQAHTLQSVNGSNEANSSIIISSPSPSYSSSSSSSNHANDQHQHQPHCGQPSSSSTSPSCSIASAEQQHKLIMLKSPRHCHFDTHLGSPKSQQQVVPHNKIDSLNQGKRVQVTIYSGSGNPLQDQQHRLVSFNTSNTVSDTFLSYFPNRND
jgi:hypothetical protein